MVLYALTVSCCALCCVERGKERGREKGVEWERGREREGEREEGGFDARPYTLAAFDRLEYLAVPDALYESWYGLLGPRRAPSPAPVPVRDPPPVPVPLPESEPGGEEDM